MKVGNWFSFFFKERNGRKERNLREGELGRKGKRQRGRKKPDFPISHQRCQWEVTFPEFAINLATSIHLPCNVFALSGAHPLIYLVFWSRKHFSFERKIYFTIEWWNFKFRWGHWLKQFLKVTFVIQKCSSLGIAFTLDLAFHKVRRLHFGASTYFTLPRVSSLINFCFLDLGPT